MIVVVVVAAGVFTFVSQTNRLPSEDGLDDSILYYSILTGVNEFVIIRST